MGSFIKTAGKQVSDLRTFLKENAGNNGIKYAAEKNARHILYFPVQKSQQIDEATGASTIQSSIYAISGKVHEWTGTDGKFKSTICIKDVIRKSEDGTILNDGICPFCDRIGDSWDIYNYRKKLEEETCKLTGEQRNKHMETTLSTYADERKTKEPRAYMYVLVAKYKLNEQGTEVCGTDGLPEYELKVMKVSSSRVEKIQQQLANSGAELEGSELVFQYPNVDDRRLLVSQSTTAPVFPSNRLITKYPALENKIAEDVAKFDWDGLDKAFPEWTGMSTSQAKATTDAMFGQWDSYKKEITVNPNARYLEYVVTSPATNPSLGTSDAPVVPPVVPAGVGSVIPGASNIPMPNVPPVVVPGVPTAAVPPVASAPAPAQAVNPNTVFSGENGAAPTVQL